MQELVLIRTQSRRRHLRRSVQRQKDRALRWSGQTVLWAQELPLNSTQTGMMVGMQVEQPPEFGWKIQSQRRVLK